MMTLAKLPNWLLTLYAVRLVGDSPLLSIFAFTTEGRESERMPTGRRAGHTSLEEFRLREGTPAHVTERIAC